jgi:hypothetical protein
VAGAGGGGLLLLMQPASKAAGASKTNQRGMRKAFHVGPSEADGAISSYKTGRAAFGCLRSPCHIGCAFATFQKVCRRSGGYPVS